MTTAAFIIFLDADDYLASNYIEKCLEHMHDSSVGVVYGDMQHIGEQGHLFRRPEFSRNALLAEGWLKNDMLIRRQAFIQAGGFRSDVHFEDRDLTNRIIRLGWKGERAETKTFYRFHSGSKMHNFLMGEHCSHYVQEAELHKNGVSICTVFTKPYVEIDSLIEMIMHLGHEKRYLRLFWFNCTDDSTFASLLEKKLSIVPHCNVHLLHCPGNSFLAMMSERERNGVSTALSIEKCARSSSDDYIFYLPPDCTCSPGTLSALLENVQIDTVAIISPFAHQKQVTDELDTSGKKAAQEAFIPVDGPILFRATSLVHDSIPMSRDIDWKHSLFQNLRKHGRVLVDWNTITENNDSFRLKKTSSVDEDCLPSVSNPAILTVIPTNGKNLQQLKKCIGSLQFASLGIKMTVVIVVCPADEEVMNNLHQAFDGKAIIKPLQAPFNYPRSINAGIGERTNQEYVLLLNDDCFFRTYEDILKLVRTLKKEKLACIGPWVENLQDSHMGYGNESRSYSFTLTRTPVMGCCALWDAKWLIERLGPFDEDFGRGYGFDESDHTLKARYLGGRWGRDDRVVVDHVHHASFGNDIFQSPLYQQNLILWSQKHPGIKAWGGDEHWDPLPKVHVILRQTEMSDNCMTVKSIRHALDGFRWKITVFASPHDAEYLASISSECGAADELIVRDKNDSLSHYLQDQKSTYTERANVNDYPVIWIVNTSDSVNANVVQEQLPVMTDMNCAIITYESSLDRGDICTSDVLFDNRKLPDHFFASLNNESLRQLSERHAIPIHIMPKRA